MPRRITGWQAEGHKVITGRISEVPPGDKPARLPYHHFVRDWQQEDWVSGIGLVSRWPVSEPQRRPLRSADSPGAGQAVHVTVDGGRGPIQLCAVMLDDPLHASACAVATARRRRASHLR